MTSENSGDIPEFRDFLPLYFVMTMDIHAHGQNRRGVLFGSEEGGLKFSRLRRKIFKNTQKIGQKNETIGKIPKKSGNIAKNHRFSLIFTLKPQKNSRLLRQFLWVEDGGGPGGTPSLPPP